jgi:DNA polymerase III delta' subunit
MMPDVFSEHKVVIGNLLSLHLDNQLPHAVLITSGSGVGLASAASSLCATLLCKGDAAEPCGECTSCSRVAAGTHGDYRWVAVAEGKASIGIDQIREVGDFVTKTSGYGSQKILVISDAEKMTTGASNALLKTLEEPQGNSFIILLSQRSWLLPATIRSRCQTWRLPALKAASSMDHLRAAGVSIPSGISGNERALERLVLSVVDGKAEARSIVTNMIEGMLSTDMSVADASAVLQGLELTDSVEAVALALEERLSNQTAANDSLIALLQLHRAIAALLQRLRNGAVPAKESTCYEIASLIAKARRDDVAAINRSLVVMGAPT